MSLLKKIKTAIEKNQLYKIVFSGDSLTSSDWLHPNWREIFEYVLKEELTKIMGDWKKPYWNIRCINAGLDGASTKDILELSGKYILCNKPQMSLMLVGINDIWQKNTPSQFLDNLTRLANLLKKENCFTIYVSPPPSSNEEKNEKFEPFLAHSEAKISEIMDLYIDLFNDFRVIKDLNKFYTLASEGNEDFDIKPGEKDFIHPNVLGNAYMAKFILEKLFRVSFSPEKYLSNMRNGIMNPSY
ncbi:hypothetical protein M1271_01255 [Patescibacteria group bacterium]|nr:hypothetical protein [Patescibacteria group bacterium]MCL5797685.1 hypothetical protein [Patescibacteria group bacterium]